MDSPLIVFVAMPGTDLGEYATWHDIEQIKEYLYKPIAKELARILGIKIDLRIEKDKSAGGDIYRSMFGEALRAPIYIADLTGANANVYLELGVRWALRDHVTVLVCQSLAHDVKFNVAGNRVIPYSENPKLLKDARDRVVGSIVSGLQDEHVDSPVRQSHDVISVPRETLEGLKKENQELRRARGDELVAAAAVATPEQARSLLEQALQVNPARADARLALGVVMTRMSDYPSAIEELRMAVALASEDATAWRELGIAQSRNLDLDDAIRSLERAAVLAPTDIDAHSALGGAYRRKARRNLAENGRYDWISLEKSLEWYAKASKLAPMDTYPVLNQARLDLLLSRGDAVRQAEALKSFHTIKSLARYMVETQGEGDPWKWLDYADTLALTGEAAEAVGAARKAADHFEGKTKYGAFEPALLTLQDLVSMDCLPEEILICVQDLIAEYQKHVRP